jgi:hypothetical protein
VNSVTAFNASSIAEAFIPTFRRSQATNFKQSLNREVRQQRTKGGLFMADDMEKNRQQGQHSGQQSGQQGQKGQGGQSGQQQGGQSGQQNQQKKGGQNEQDNEDLDRQRRAS